MPFYNVLVSVWYTDFITGTSTLKRSGFQQALQDAQGDRFDVLLVYHTSRFARNRADAIRYKAELRLLGKTVVFVSQGIISGNDNDFLNEGINEVLDEHYSRNLSLWVRDGLRVKALEGNPLGNAPLGFKHVPRAGGRGVDTVIDEATMPALLALLGGYESGQHSFNTIAQELNARGHRMSYGRTFTASSISTVLNNRFYVGKVVYHRGKPDEEIIEGVHRPPDEVRDLWLRCQDVRQGRKQPGWHSPPVRQQRVYPLTRVLVCDSCDQPFHGVACFSKGRLYPRMQHGWHRCGTRPQSVPAPRVEQEFAQGVLAYVDLDDGWRQAVLRAPATEGSEPDHTVEIKRIDGALSNLRKQHLWGSITDEEFKVEFQALHRQRKSLKPMSLPQRLPNLERAAHLLRDLTALWQHPGVTPEQRRDLAREVFEELRIREGGLVAVKPRPQYAPLFAYSLWRQHQVVGGVRSS